MSYMHKAVYRDKENIVGFLNKFGVGRGKTMFLTFTTKRIISDKKEVSKHFNTFLTFLRSKRYRKKFLLEYGYKYNPNMINSPLKYFCCWELQKRGSWHCHMIIHLPFWSTSMLNEYLRFIRFTIKGSIWGFLEAKWTYGNLEGVKCYLSKYATKELREFNPGTRLVSYSRNFPRIVRLPFMWVDGRSAEWRNMWKSLAVIYPQSIETIYNYMPFGYQSDMFELSNLMSRVNFIATYAKHHLIERHIYLIINDLECFKARLMSSSDCKSLRELGAVA